MTEPADLGVLEAGTALASRELSSSELTQACLARIRERDGAHSFDGDPASINAWIRVYEEDALAAAAAADARLAAGDAPPLCGIPIGLKDLYGVAGKPLTASSRLLDETPERDCDVWARLRAEGMVLLGHLHTHEFAAGGTTDQTGSPWGLERSAGGSSGGSAAALAARMVPAATGTDTAGSLRIPAACCGLSTIKPTRGLVSLRGVVPLASTLDHAGPMARTLDDCALLLSALAGIAQQIPAAGSKPLAGVRLAVSPRLEVIQTPLEPEIADAFDAALELCRRLGAQLVAVPADVAPLDIFAAYADVLGADLLSYHRRFDGRRELYRPSIREFVELAEQRALPAWEYVQLQAARAETAARWTEWLAAERVAAVVEPTQPVTALLRGRGYERAFSDAMLLDLTHYWNWTGFPAVALPMGVGARSGLPASISLIGAAGTDTELLRLGIALQGELGVPVPPGF